jgi:hypothetical protein
VSKIITTTNDNTFSFNFVAAGAAAKTTGPAT